MRGLIFLTLIPTLMADHLLCPNGKTTCPEEFDCCEIEGQPTCCDRYATTTPPDTKIKIFPGKDTTEVKPATMISLNESISDDLHPKFRYGTCSSYSCRGPCCSTYDCCPHQYGSCCNSNRCCGDFGSCCGTGCCGALTSCCGSRCCERDYKCCSTDTAQWCCHVLFSCGKRPFTCSNTGVIFYSQIATVLVLALSVLMSRRL